jgi:HTH-type transcriptional regulator / antitoxin HigA
MKAKVIKNQADHQAVMNCIDEIFDVRRGTPERDELELLTTLVALYEKKAFPIDPPELSKP